MLVIGRLLLNLRVFYLWLFCFAVNDFEQVAVIVDKDTVWCEMYAEFMKLPDKFAGDIGRACNGKVAQVNGFIPAPAGFLVLIGVNLTDLEPEYGCGSHGRFSSLDRLFIDWICA